MSDPFLGQITLFPYTFPPNQWMDCSGQLLPISQFTALFSLLGTQYGGNGTSNFALPDLQGRVPVGQGQATGGSSYVMGETDGQASVTLTQGQMASHNHSLAATGTAGTATNPQNNVLAFAQFTGTGRPPPTATGNIYNPAAPTAALSATSVGLAGGNLGHNNVQPTLTLRYCIAVAGVFPARP